MHAVTARPIVNNVPGRTLSSYTPPPMWRHDDPVPCEKGSFTTTNIYLVPRTSTVSRACIITSLILFLPSSPSSGKLRCAEKRKQPDLIPISSIKEPYITPRQAYSSFAPDE